MPQCPYCKDERSSKRSVDAHAPFCKSNPNARPRIGGARKGSVPWNSGLRDDPRCQHSDETKRRIGKATASLGAEWHKEQAKRISKTINKKVADGTWHTSLARHMHIDYNGVDLHGTWELKYAQYLDANGIKWKRNTDSFQYEFNGKIRKYTPDFYLPDSDVYVEIKGYKTEKDDAKWKHFPSHRTLIVLMREQLLSLGINV